MRNLIAAAFAAFLAVAPVQAQQRCGPAETLGIWLEEQFGERPIYRATMADGQIIVLFANDDTQSWTMAIFNGGVACLVASGSGLAMTPAGVRL